MTKDLQVYKCSLCGNMTEVVHAGPGTMICCNQPMDLMEENVTDAATEKHVPVVESTNPELVVKVGSVDHPMDDVHYIEWIEVVYDGMVMRQHLKPGQEPKAVFKAAGAPELVRAYCNLHGLWKS